MDNLILIGMPGAGKSTVGVLLAKELGFRFLDTDLEIQSGEGRRLQQIIAAEGIANFCRLEEQYIQGLSCRRTVIATGGSVVYRPAAMKFLARLGTLVYLDASLTVLHCRLGDIDARGVVHSAGQTLADLHQERAPLYRRYADVIVYADSSSPAAVAADVLSAFPPDRFGGSEARRIDETPYFS